MMCLTPAEFVTMVIPAVMRMLTIMALRAELDHLLRIWPKKQP